MKKTAKTLLAALALTVTAMPCIVTAETLKVIGQPLATGLIQREMEQPFFETLAETTGLPLEVDYKPVDTLGIKDTEQLRVLKAGLFDVVSLRVLRNSRDEPALVGLDLVGASPDYVAGRKVVDAWSGTLDARLQEKFGVKLLGVWPFGPQILFCSKPIESLESLAGLKVRVIDQNLAKVLETLGAIPVPMSFPDVHQALSLGVVDCAVTDPSSANSASWPEVTTHQMPLGFQMSPNAYAITLKKWNAFSPEQQITLQEAFTKLTNDIWQFSESLNQDALICNSGGADCEKGKLFKLTTVPVTDKDLEIVRNAVATISVPVWAETCDKAFADCSSKWKAEVGPVVGIE